MGIIFSLLSCWALYSFSQEGFCRNLGIKNIRIPLKNYFRFVLGFRNLWYVFLGVGGDVWRWLYRYMRQTFLFCVFGGMNRPIKCGQGARTPICMSRNLQWIFTLFHENTLNDIPRNLILFSFTQLITALPSSAANEGHCPSPLNNSSFLHTMFYDF